MACTSTLGDAGGMMLQLMDLARSIQGPGHDGGIKIDYMSKDKSNRLALSEVLPV